MKWNSKWELQPGAFNSKWNTPLSHGSSCDALFSQLLVVPRSVTGIRRPKHCWHQAVFAFFFFVCLFVGPSRRLQWIWRYSIIGAPLRPPPEWPVLLWDNPLTTGHHGEHTADTHSSEPSSLRGPSGTSAWQLGDGLHWEGGSLLHRVRNILLLNVNLSFFFFFSTNQIHHI